MLIAIALKIESLKLNQIGLGGLVSSKKVAILKPFKKTYDYKADLIQIMHILSIKSYLIPSYL